MDPYAYVNGNPETLTDPTGQVTHCHEPGDCGPGSYTTNVSGGDTGPGESVCIYLCSVGSSGSNDDGAYHPKPRLNGGGGGNPKIVPPTATPVSTVSAIPTKPQPRGIIINPGLNRLGWFEVGAGITLLVAGIVGFSLSVDNPFGAALLSLAKDLIKNALVLVISRINQGLRDILDSYDGVDPHLRLAIDIVAFLLDAAGIVTNTFLAITSITGARAAVGGSTSFIKNVVDMAENESNISKGIGGPNCLPIAIASLASM